MGVELVNNDMEIVFTEETDCVSDSVAFALVNEALIDVARGDKEQYYDLLNILDPTKMPEEEALIVATLKALSGAISKLDNGLHAALLKNIYDMSIWNYGLDVRNALVELITCLAAVPDKFLDECLHMLVCNFLPPLEVRDSLSHRSETLWLKKKKEVQGQVHQALHCIADLVPLAIMKLKEIAIMKLKEITIMKLKEITMNRKCQKIKDNKEVTVMYVECMLMLERSAIGEFLGNTLLAKVVEMLTDLDVNISWEDLLQEDFNKGMFDMELEDMEENADAPKSSESTNGIFKGNEFADKLDGLMVVVCEHLKSCADNGHLVKVFDTLTESFQKTVLNAYKSKFAQFVMFYACSLDPEICGLKFAVILTDIFLSKTEGPNSRMSAVAYLASYLSRAKFISSSLAASILKRLVDWCFEYCQFQSGRQKTIDPSAHRIFYSGCQGSLIVTGQRDFFFNHIDHEVHNVANVAAILAKAVMYALCFRMRSMMDIPYSKSLLFDMPLESILCHNLDPLMVCLPTIVQEFLRQAKAARLFTKSTTFPFDNLLESKFSKAFGGIERLDMFFPFDPYLLKESDRYMRPNFKFWSMVRTTYSNCNSEDEDEELDECFEGHDNPDLDGEDDLDLSLNKMSITPNWSFKHHLASNLQIPSRMPAKIRPSMSPDR